MSNLELRPPPPPLRLRFCWCCFLLNRWSVNHIALPPLWSGLLLLFFFNRWSVNSSRPPPPLVLSCCF